MPIWSPTYTSLEKWTTWEHALSQHRQLLEVGGQVCKVLFKNQIGNEVGVPEDPIPVAIWDTTSSYPRKIIWKEGDDTVLYPNPQDVKVFVDDVELTQTYSVDTIQSNNEFYIEIVRNSVDETDKVSFYLNSGFDITGKAISYCYTTRGKNVDPNNIQPKEDTANFRSIHGFTQYISATSSFRGVITPNIITLSFPPPPSFDTRYLPLGAAEEWRNRVWTLGDVRLHENDIIYRVSDARFYEITDYEPNYLKYKEEWKLLTQSFTLVQLGPNDIIRQFPLV